MRIVQIIGYGRFHLEDFLFGERFARHDGSQGIVCERQPRSRDNAGPLLPNHVLVWINYGTLNATKTYLHRRAPVHAWTAEQARPRRRRPAVALLQCLQPNDNDE